MTLELDSNGLPKPGRELDAWIWVNVLCREPVPWEPHVDVECPYCRQEMYRTDRRAWCSTCREWRYSPYQEYSTTHAFFQVMEAMESCDRQYGWAFADYTDEVDMLLWDKSFLETRRLWEVELEVADYPDRIHAWAHAVCCCAWEAMGGENA